MRPLKCLLCYFEQFHVGRPFLTHETAEVPKRTVEDRRETGWFFA